MSDKAETVCPTCHGKGRIEANGNQFQGNWHDMPSGSTNGPNSYFPSGCIPGGPHRHAIPDVYLGTVVGYPRTAAHVKTWLDECAMMAMGGLIESAFTHMTEETERGKPMTPGAVAICEEIGKTAYVIAEKMLAEKLRRENEAAEGQKGKE